MILRDEDAVRDGYSPSDGSDFIDGAKQILGFDKPEKDVQQGTGQIKTFNQLGFIGYSDKPDGWYLPLDTSKPAIVLESKAEKEDIFNTKWEAELLKNTDIVLTKYPKVISILYNGKDVRVFKNKEELSSAAPDLQNKEYYLSLFNKDSIDKDHIYELTQTINNILHFKFGMTDLQDRDIHRVCSCGAAIQPGARAENPKRTGLRYRPRMGIKQTCRSHKYREFERS